MSADRHELAREQATLDALYERLDLLRDRTAGRLEEAKRRGTTGTAQSRSERDAFVHLYEERADALRGVEERLCFGRLDLRDGSRRYVGRVGLADDHGTQQLVDWRAPAARSFYQATAATPGDVVRRRHLVTAGRQVTGVEDDVLDLDAIPEDEREHLGGEGALLSALSARRTGRMRDIVATIQAEQDRVIRSELGGVLVVQGGPGTGKTAVALHRAAYLLYTHRDRLDRRGVLVVGPNARFLRYIEQVLPSLGETGVVMSTAGQLFPGVDAVGVESDAVAALKGSRHMARVIANAVRDRQRVPTRPLSLDVDGRTVVLQPRVVEAARARARRQRRPHNGARESFLRDLLDHLAGRLARVLGVDVDDHREDLLADLRDSRDVRRELNLLWMPVTPERLLADLYADPARLASAAPRLSQHDRALLRRDRRAPWTPADVPLLDEAAELLGEDDTASRMASREEDERRRRDLEHAREVLKLSGEHDDEDLGPLSAYVSAEALVERFADTGPSRTLAERAAHDRTWAYGHVVVDEAQELSPMAWRMLMRRIPSRSMTVVGDLAQTGSAAGVSSWAEALDPYVEGRWRLEELTVNYRTPRQVMDLAAGVLAAHGVPASVPTSVRDADVEPSAYAVSGVGGLPDEVVRVVAKERAELGDGRLAVLTPRGLHDAVALALVDALEEGEVSYGLSGPAALDAPVTVLTVTEAKGLEVDTVVLVEPAAVLEESSLGVHDLYVALTRPTQRLRVVHATALPAGLDVLTA